MEIKMISTELIKPSSPTPSDCRDYKLPFMSEMIRHSYIPLILYYPTPINFNRSEISKWLKTSLSETLSQFYPMAGRINEYQNSIDCNDEGIFYAESQVDGNLLEVVNSPDVQILDQLIPCKSCGTISSRHELLAIQVNLFKCGGIAIGICQSHRIADGCSLCSFILGWAAKAAAAAAPCGPRKTPTNSTLPLFNAASLFPPRNSPDTNANSKTKVLQPPLEKMVTKRFIFTSSTIELLKSQVSNSSSYAKPTRVQVVSAYIWKCCMVAKGLGKDDEYSVAMHPVNLRRRIVPPLPDSLFGNIFQMAFAVACGGEDWIGLVGILRRAIGKLDQEFCNRLLGGDGYEFSKSNFHDISKYVCQKDMHIVRFSSWCGFPLYDADFGCGTPIWVSSTSYSCKDIVFLFDSKSSSTGSGGIEAWLTMAENEMARFEQQMDFIMAISS